ncbi:MAG: class I SAM-dependent methyltransferase [Candidatus Bathyarchaeia archaeon]
MKKNEEVLDLGCGHSLLPSLLRRRGVQVLALDVTRDSVVWQARIGDKSEKQLKSAILSSIGKLPFKDNSISKITVISVLEHILDDMEAAKEIGRVLGPKGVCVVSVPVVSGDTTLLDAGWTVCLPRYLKHLPVSTLETFFKRFEVDRGDNFLFRQYCIDDVFKRIVEPAGCVLEDWVVYESALANVFYHTIIPIGVLSLLEYVLAGKYMNKGKMPRDCGGIILKLRKRDSTF